MPRKAVGKVYKSAVMMQLQTRFDRKLAEVPGFRESIRPPHEQPTRPFRPVKTTHPSRPTFNAVYASDPASFGLHPSPSASSSSDDTPIWSSPPSKDLPAHTHPKTLPPLTYLERLLDNHLPPSKGLTEELALQMITHIQYPAAHRGTAPHNLKMSFMGRRVLEMHLQMFLLHADAQRVAGSKPAVIDAFNATEEVTPVTVVEAEQEGSQDPAEVVAEKGEADLSEIVTGRPAKQRVTDVLAKSLEPTNRWTAVNLGDAAPVPTTTPGSLMDRALSEAALGQALGDQWRVSDVMLYDAENPNILPIQLSRYRGSVVQSIFGGLSHAYGVALTNRLFLAQVLPALKSRLPQWTWNTIEEQQLKVEQEGGVWGKK